MTNKEHIFAVAELLHAGIGLTFILELFELMQLFVFFEKQKVLLTNVFCIRMIIMVMLLFLYTLLLFVI